MNRRLAAAGILALWLMGLGVLVHREYFRPHLEQLAEAATRVAPGHLYYTVVRDGQQLGYASAAIDTTDTAFIAMDYFAVDVPARTGRIHSSVQTTIDLSRALRVRGFEYTASGAPHSSHVIGRTSGDSVMLFSVDSGAGPPATHRLALDGPVLLPTLIPLAVAFSDRLKLGRHYVLPVLDPATMRVANQTLNVVAESLFVLSDSAVFDSTARRWRGITPDTVRAWQVTAESGPPLSEWIDEQGRVVETTQLGFLLRRVPYEVAFENWRLASLHE